ncbi:MAG: nicotinate-nucleotide adenylyltransferase [Planctomycetia bacterium]|nr:nicotinate-nucleotide adenylyltransferase [Planctomycetia bacterium]
MRLGLFGGTFDPVHLGHLLLAESCREQCSLDEVWFVPAAVPPHKQQAQPASAENRIEMLNLAIGGQPSFAVCDLELKRGGVSYTIDTLRELKSQQPERELFLLVGADTLADLPNWREPDEVCKLALPIVIGRPVSPEPDFNLLRGIASPERIEQMRGHHIETPLVDISSQDIRRRVAAGHSIRFLVPRAVEEFIRVESLYRPQ